MTMNNCYIRLFKAEIEKFLKVAREISAEKKSNSSRFQPEVATAENAKLNQRLENECYKAKNNINSIYESVRGCLSIASFPPAEVSDPYLMYFIGTSPRTLTEEEMQVLIDEYTRTLNFGMLEVARQYIDDYNSNKNAKERKYLTARDSIHSPKDLLQFYQNFGKGAVGLCDRILEAPEQFGDWQLEAYAEESYTQNAFAVIGNGAGLSTFADRKVPEGAKHLFDDKTVPLDNSIPTGFDQYRHIQND